VSTKPARGRRGFMPIALESSLKRNMVSAWTGHVSSIKKNTKNSTEGVYREVGLLSRRVELIEYKLDTKMESIEQKLEVLIDAMRVK
jgi:hypothetical protein